MLPLKALVRTGGFEPPTLSMSRTRSSRLSYTLNILESDFLLRKLEYADFIAKRHQLVLVVDFPRLFGEFGNELLRATPPLQLFLHFATDGCPSEGMVLRQLHLDVRLFQHRTFLFRFMVGESGFEPPTLSLSEKCSNQLSYSPILNLVELAGLEPATFYMRSRCSSQLNYSPISEKTEWSWRDPNPRPSECKSDVLPTELQPRYVENI